MSNTHTLAFPDFDTAKTVAQALGFWSEGATRPDGTTSEPTWLTGGQSIDPETDAAFSWAIDVIGHIQVEPAVMDWSSFPPVQTSPAVLSDEFYVNVIGVPPPAAEAYLAEGGYGSAGRVFA